MSATNGSTKSEQPQCEDCGHVLSFHGSGKTRCRALGCGCQSYIGVSLLATQTMSVADVAESIERSESWVRAHAEELGGEQVPNAELFCGKPRSGTSMRFTARGVKRGNKAYV